MIIDPGERCAFLHVDTNAERDQFVEQFWLRRSSDPDTSDNDFKEEHYHRIAVANERFGKRPAWKTDRGRIYIIFGPPDSIDVHADGENAAAPSHGQSYGLPTEKWHYRYIEGIGKDVDLDFVYIPNDEDYRLVLSEDDQTLLIASGAGHPLGNSEFYNLTQSKEEPELYIGPTLSPKIRFKDLEAIVVSGIVREQVEFSQRLEFSQATHTTTSARIQIQIPWDARSPDGHIIPSVAYELFIRVSKPSG